MGRIKINGQELKHVHVNNETLRNVWVRGERVWPNMIEDFEEATHPDDILRGSHSGTASITSAATLVSDSTQGLRCDGFVERYALPGDHDPGLESGREASFFFRPNNLGSNQFHFLIAPQASASHPPDRCYRLEFHMSSGSRITRMDSGGRTVLETELNTSWSTTTYECTFTVNSDGVTMSVADETLSTSDTTYVDDLMGFGFRASGGGSVDWDWFGY